jgi:hypothetical protein
VQVDLILHPLKSELNWPLGRKRPLDMTRGRPGSKLGDGLRWQIPFHLLDALFYCRYVVRCTANCGTALQRPLQVRYSMYPLSMVRNELLEARRRPPLADTFSPTRRTLQARLIMY